MLHRRISSYILLVIFFLSITHNPIIVNSAQSAKKSKTHNFGKRRIPKFMLEVNSVVSSHDAASRITVLCDDSVRLYQSSFKHLTDLDEIRNWVNKMMIQTTKLIIQMSILCDKITTYEDAVSVFIDLFSVSNELKKPIHNTHTNSWIEVKQHHFYEISNLMKSLISLCNGEYKDEKLTECIDLFNSANSLTQQLNIFFDMLKHLVSHFENSEDAMRLILKYLLLTGDSIENLQLEGMLEILLILSPRIEISKSATQFIEQLSEFASKYKQFHLLNIPQILDIIEKLIPKVKGSKHILLVINHMMNIIINPVYHQEKEIGVCFELHHLQRILLILKPLIKRIKDSDDVTPIEQNLIIIKNWFLDQFCENEIIPLLDEIIGLFPRVL